MHIEKYSSFLGLILFIISFSLNLTIFIMPALSLNIDQIQDLETRLMIWKRDLKSSPVPKNARKLQYKFSFPSEKLEKKDIYLFQGSNLCLDNEKNIYISDSRAHTILKFDMQGNFLKKIGQKGQGPEELINPLAVLCDSKGHLLIQDDGNRRIQIFNLTGKFLKSFKYFKSYTFFDIDKTNLIYASYSSPNLKDTIIDVLDMEGRLIKSFGERIEFKHHRPAHNEIFLSINTRGEIYIVWKYFNYIRKYSNESKLLSEFQIKYKPIIEITKKNLKVKKEEKTGGIKFYNIFTGLQAKENGFYLFKSYPRIEILEINDKGQIENIYWHDTPFRYISFDFLLIENGKEKIFYILQVFPENKIEVLCSQGSS